MHVLRFSVLLTEQGKPYIRPGGDSAAVAGKLRASVPVTAMMHRYTLRLPHVCIGAVLDMVG